MATLSSKLVIIRTERERVRKASFTLGLGAIDVNVIINNLMIYLEPLEIQMFLIAGRVRPCLSRQVATRLVKHVNHNNSDLLFNYLMLGPRLTASMWNYAGRRMHWCKFRHLVNLIHPKLVIDALGAEVAFGEATTDEAHRDAFKRYQWAQSTQPTGKKCVYQYIVVRAIYNNRPFEEVKWLIDNGRIVWRHSFLSAVYDIEMKRGQNEIYKYLMTMCPQKHRGQQAETMVAIMLRQKHPMPDKLRWLIAANDPPTSFFRCVGMQGSDELLTAELNAYFEIGGLISDADIEKVAFMHPTSLLPIIRQHCKSRNRLMNSWTKFYNYFGASVLPPIDKMRQAVEILVSFGFRHNYANDNSIEVIYNNDLELRKLLRLV